MLVCSEPPTVKTELAWAVPFLHKNGITDARLEAEVLLAESLGWTRSKLLSRLPDRLEPDGQKKFREWVEKRAEHYPLQYITGHQEFMSLDFEVNPHVLIPRDDTEILVQTVLGLKHRVPSCPKIIEVGTGSGIIAITLKKFWPEAEICAVDISPEALQVARKNAQKHDVEITLIQGDLLKPFLSGKAADIIVSNPPYIPGKSILSLQREVAFEPIGALDGGEDGLEFYRRLVIESKKVLAKNGWLAVEIGCDQGKAVTNLLNAQGFAVSQLVQDFAKLDRVVFGTLSN